jgi:hypothetical protein
MPTVPELNIELSVDTIPYKSPKDLVNGISVIADQTQSKMLNPYYQTSALNEKDSFGLASNINQYS